MEKEDMISNMLGQRIKRLRESKKLSLEELAAKAHISKNTLVRLEKGAEKDNQNRSSLATILSVANVLSVSLSALLEAKPEEGLDYKQVCTGPRRQRRIIKKEPGTEVEDISVHLQGGLLHVGILEISGTSSMRSHQGEEFLFCVTGRIKLHIHGEEIELDKGDGVVFWGSEPHSYSYLEGGKDPKQVAIGLSVIAAGPEIKVLEDLFYISDMKG